jgi:hypothetical protein
VYYILFLQIETACPVQGLEQCILQSKNFDAFGPIALNDDKGEILAFVILVPKDQ